MMTKKDYVAIAGIVKEARSKPASRTSLLAITKQLGDYLESSNPKFDKSRFFQACMPSTFTLEEHTNANQG